MRLTILSAVVLGAAVWAQRPAPAPPQAPTPVPARVMTRGSFSFAYDERGISQLRHPDDPYGATVTTPAPAGRGGVQASPQRAATLGLTIAYRAGGGSNWTTAVTRGAMTASPEAGTVRYSNAGAGPLAITETYSTDGSALDWTIDLAAVGTAVRIGDLGITLPVQGPTGENPAQIFERGFLKHQFVSGAGSFFFYVRASGAPPFLLVTARPGTKLEYFSGGGRAGGTMFVHSARSGNEEKRGTWRQDHTALDLKAGARARYGFRLQWARSYDALRDLLYENGLFDVRVVPGMTVPSDLSATFSLRTRANVESVTAEFPGQTTVTSLVSPAGTRNRDGCATGARNRDGCATGAQPDARLYAVTFRRLGENMLTITHDGGRKTYLEFFVTEPLETLIRKRASFLVNRQQIRNPAKWWDGVYGPYDMKAKVVRTIDDPDIFVDRMVYALTCDDPGLAKAPFLAAKNVTYPDKAEIESLEYYITHFVWGGLQRRDDERPYPYGVYGTPNWFVNRDPARRKAYAESLANGATAKADLAKEHVWRSYDYPHVVMLYYHMYQVAKLYPEMVTALDAAGYLNRAWETARAFYTYPYEIYPSYYDTYKWGLYNELVVLDVIDALTVEGYPEQAKWLTGEWEKKTKYFVYDDAYPFRSEYAFDRTAFESTYALAKYGATHDMAPDRNLWFDLKLKKWWSHPTVRREDSRAFMDRQLASGLVVRGWLNPAYYTLGADPGVSYMAAMGGWGVLDYALNFAPSPYDWLQLGYASYLSSWCLVNSGTAESGYGAWFPGRENDGAAGWQFMSAKAGSAWMGSSVPGGVTVPRGPWHYDGEIDLGFGGALRMAATVITNDPTFGWVAYGGGVKDDGGRLLVKPRDGVRRRLAVVVQDPALPFADSLARLKVELERDGFATSGDISVDKSLEAVTFAIENRTGSAHRTGIRLSFPVNSRYVLTADGAPVTLAETGNPDYPWRAEVPVSGPTTAIAIRRR